MQDEEFMLPDGSKVNGGGNLGVIKDDDDESNQDSDFSGDDQPPPAIAADGTPLNGDPDSLMGLAGGGLELVPHQDVKTHAKPKASEPGPIQKNISNGQSGG